MPPPNDWGAAKQAEGRVDRNVGWRLRAGSNRILFARHDVGLVACQKELEKFGFRGRLWSIEVQRLCGRSAIVPVAALQLTRRCDEVIGGEYLKGSRRYAAHRPRPLPRSHQMCQHSGGVASSESFTVGLNGIELRTIDRMKCQPQARIDRSGCHGSSFERGAFMPERPPCGGRVRVFAASLV